MPAGMTKSVNHCMSQGLHVESAGNTGVDMRIYCRFQA